MKNFYTFCILLTSAFVFAQEAGKAGQLLKNEVQRSDNQTDFSKPSGINKYGSISGNAVKGTQTGRRIPKSNTDYRWNYNYGTSEVFLRIPEEGRFTIEIGDQSITNATGKFRFFDLRAGIVPISIYDNNFLIYRTRIALQNDTRTVLDFFYNEGLFLLGNFPQNNQSYGFNEWDDIWNNPYTNQQGIYNGNTSSNYYGNSSGYYGSQNQYFSSMQSQDFANFVKTLKRDARTDDTKMMMISSATQFSSFSSRQIADLLKLLNFESNKLNLAKQLYKNCTDKQNFYQVYGVFNFESTKRELNEYISKN